MNVFLIQPDIRQSCAELVSLDIVRARKQLVECCQLLASIEWATTGKCTMVKKNGELYGRSHPYHPCVTHALISGFQQWLTNEVAQDLATMLHGHACSKSLSMWEPLRRDALGKLVVVRKGHAHAYVTTLAEYVALIRPYVLAKVAASHTANGV